MPPVVDTRFGRLQGRTEGGLHVFRGVPYASPPVGDLRFRAPRPPESWAGVLDASEFGPSTIQHYQDGIELLGMDARPTGEDCLTLNIWTSGLDEARRPVMLWIHGGAYVAGSGNERLYDGQHLARRGDVVVVTINYRVGSLGFLWHESLIDAGDPRSGNYGTRDQLAALAWVRDHIGAFGGDPDNITIFGESAGGFSVSTLMAAREAEGMFRRAIPQSGAGHHALPLEMAQEIGRRFCSLLEINPDDAAATLRSMPALDILDAQNAILESPDTLLLTWRYGMPFCPVIDGDFLDVLPIVGVQRGRGRDVDLMAGTVEDEWTTLAVFYGFNEMTDALARQTIALRTGSGEIGEQLYDFYRDARASRGQTTDPLTVWDSVLTDFIFRIPTDRLLGAHANAGGAGGTYAYLFNQQSPAMDGRLRAGHGIDMPFVFGTTHEAREFVGADPQTDQLKSFVMDAWLNFAKTGNPSTRALPGWPQWREDQRYTMVFGPDVKVIHEDRELERSLWATTLRGVLE